MKSEGCEVRKKKKKKRRRIRKQQRCSWPEKKVMVGGGALKDCFAKDLSFVLFLLVFFFSLLYWICDCLKVFLII